MKVPASIRPGSRIVIEISGKFLREGSHVSDVIYSHQGTVRAAGVSIKLDGKGRPVLCIKKVDDEDRTAGAASPHWSELNQYDDIRISFYTPDEGAKSVDDISVKPVEITQDGVMKIDVGEMFISDEPAFDEWSDRHWNDERDEFWTTEFDPAEDEE